MANDRWMGGDAIGCYPPASCVGGVVVVVGVARGGGVLRCAPEDGMDLTDERRQYMPYRPGVKNHRGLRTTH